MYLRYKCLSMMGLQDAGIHLGPVDVLIQAMQFRNIYKTPLYQLLVVVEKAILLLPANGLCLACGGLIVNGANQPQLLIKLWCVISLATNYLKNDFSKIPVHGDG